LPPTPIDELPPGEIFTVPPNALTPETLRRGIARSGCVLVPRLVPKPAVDLLVHDIDRALGGYDSHATGSGSTTSPWLQPFEPEERYRKGGKILANRESVPSGGGVWTIDSPRALYDLLETLDDTRLTPVTRASSANGPRSR
jgi:hypothetical protein